MSVVQFGENTVSIVLEDKRYVIRELEIGDEVFNNTKFDSTRLIAVWKSHCLTKKNLTPELSNIEEKLFVETIHFKGIGIEIHFEIHQTRTGLFKDKRAVAFAVSQKS